MPQSEAGRVKGQSNTNLDRIAGGADSSESEPVPTITEWFWETDSDHRYTYVSSQNAVITGFSPSQIIGRRREDFAHDRDDPKWERHLADLAAHRPFWSFQYPIKLPDGRIVHLSVSGEPRFDEDGRFIGYRGAASDVTKRRRAEQELSEARELFRAVLDHAPVGIVLKDREGRYLEVSQEWQSRFGLCRDEVIGKTATEVLPSQISQAYEARDSEVLKSGDEAIFEEQLEQPDGTKAYFLSTRFPIRGRDGDITGVGLISADITGRKLAELAHVESEQHIHAIADNLPVLIARHDRLWRHRFINSEGARWYGTTPDQLVGKAVSDLISGEVCAAIRPLVDRALQGESTQFSGVAEYPDGKTRHVVINYVPDFAADGSIQGWFSLAVDVTEKEAAERTLRNAEEERRTVTDNLPVLMARLDRDWRYRFINLEGARWYGMDPGNVVGRTIPELFSRKTVEAIQPCVESALRGETARYSGEISYPDGKTRATEITFVPDRTADGAVGGWFALAQDMTERQRAAEELRRQEHQLTAIADNLPVLICRFDKQARFEFLNKEGEQWYGRPTSEIIGKTVAEILGPESSATVGPWMERALNGEPVRFEEKVRYPDGTLRDVDITYIPDITPDGEVSGCIALVQKITEYKAVESRLRESETRLKAVVNNLPAFITYVSGDQRYRFANRVAEEWYGRPASEIIGRHLSAVHKPVSMETLRSRVESVLSGQEQRFEVTLLYPDNVTRTVDQRWIPDRGENGDVRGWFSLIQDISDRKKLEADLLRQERLATLGQLTGTVAHELRNPLGAVAASVAALRRNAADTGLDVERSLSRAERGIWRCERIITELLDFARAKGLQRRSTPFAGWLTTILSEHEIPAGITLTTEFADEGLKISIYREDLRRAIINIIDNACQALSGEYPEERALDREIRVTTRKLDDSLLCEIADNGPGIPPESLDRVLEPLFSTKSFGTGLGLPTVQRILEAHGGGMRIESVPGEGASVTLRLPICEQDEGDEGNVQSENTDR